MSYLNRCTLIGRLGQDPKINYTQNGKAVANFTLATSMPQVGEGKKDSVEWHRVTCWEKLADNAAKFLAKGKLVYVEGRIQSREYTDKAGSKKFITEIIATNIQFLSPREDSGRSTLLNNDDSTPTQLPSNTPQNTVEKEDPYDYSQIPF